MPRIDEVYESKFFNAATLKGKQGTFTILRAEPDYVGQGDDRKLQIVLTFDEIDKPLGLNKTNARAIANLFGEDTDDWINEQIVVFPTRVDYQGRMVDAVRVEENASRKILQDKLRAQKAQRTAPAAAAATKPMTQKEVVAEGFDQVNPNEDLPF